MSVAATLMQALEDLAMEEVEDQVTGPTVVEARACPDCNRPFTMGELYFGHVCGEEEGE